MKMVLKLLNRIPFAKACSEIRRRYYITTRFDSEMRSTYRLRVKIFAVFFLSCPVFLCFGNGEIPGYQVDKSKKDVKFSELFTRMFSSKEGVYYENVRFVNDLRSFENGDDPLDPSYFLRKKLGKKDSLGYIHTLCSDFILKDCLFDDDLRFTKIIFNSRWSAESCTMLGRTAEGVFNFAFQFDSCLINSQFDITNGDKIHRSSYLLNNCRINDLWIELTNRSELNLRECVVQSISKIYADENSNISFSNTQFHNGSEMKENSVVIFGNSLFTMDSCKLNASNDFLLEFIVNQGELNISGSSFGGKTRIISSDRIDMQIRNNRFYQLLSPSLNEVSRLSKITSDGLSGFRFYPFDSTNMANQWAGNPDSLVFDFQEAIASCKVFYDHFKEVGNTELANQVYGHIQDIEYKRLLKLYGEKPSFKYFFSLQLSKLLKFYTNYGTDPARALVVSFYIIILFGVFYFFFPSDWDLASKSILIQNFRIFIEKNDSGYVKPFLILTFGLFVSLVNAATLSLNSFTTLGFGNIPTIGLARYVCVIQGFIGWFLLSLFTVALINQSQF